MSTPTPDWAALSAEAAAEHEARLREMDAFYANLLAD